MLNEEIRVDLHIHTTASDGCWIPQELVQQIMKKKIDLFAVTDHDTVDNIIETQALAEENELLFLPGVEVSATYQGQLYHILGYGIDPFHKQFLELLAHNRFIMELNDNQSIELLIKRGYNIDVQEYKNYENEPSRGGWKALNFLIDKGLCKDSRDFFTSLFDDDYRAPFPTFPTPEEVIKLINSAGGVAVLAHPGCHFYELPLLETLQLFFNFNVDGIECFHSEHDVEVSHFSYCFCKEHNLLITGGSDCHGNLLKNRPLGEPKLYIKDLNLGRLQDVLKRKKRSNTIA